MSSALAVVAYITIAPGVMANDTGKKDQASFEEFMDFEVRDEEKLTTINPNVALRKSKCPAAFCSKKSILIYEPGMDDNYSKAVEVGDSRAYVKITAEESSDSAYILVKPVNIDGFPESVEGTVGKEFPFSLNKKIESRLSRQGYILKNSIEGELCGEGNGYVAMKTYQKGKNRLVKFFDLSGGESASGYVIFDKKGKEKRREYLTLDSFCKSR